MSDVFWRRIGAIPRGALEDASKSLAQVVTTIAVVQNTSPEAQKPNPKPFQPVVIKLDQLQVILSDLIEVTQIMSTEDIDYHTVYENRPFAGRRIHDAYNEIENIKTRCLERSGQTRSFVRVVTAP